jgi:hypothetical protein
MGPSQKSWISKRTKCFFAQNKFETKIIGQDEDDE